MRDDGLAIVRVYDFVGKLVHTSGKSDYETCLNYARSLLSCGLEVRRGDVTTLMRSNGIMRVEIERVM